MDENGVDGERRGRKVSFLFFRWRGENLNFYFYFLDLLRK